MTRILVAGVGNIFCGDDAYGVEVVSRLARSAALPRAVVVKDFGIKGLDLAYALMDGWDCAVIVDASARGEAPGTVSVIEPRFDEEDKEEQQPLFASAHGLDPAKVLRLVATLGGNCKRILFVVCEPSTLGGEDGALGLSDIVASAVEPSVRLIEDLVSSLPRDEGDLQGSSLERSAS
jgi:hydrogenase maturation protease